MAYDMDSAKIFLYGGNTGYHSGHNTDTWMFDYSTLTWKEMSPPNNPSPPRGDFDMAYAPPLKSMVLYGGYNKTHNFGDTWLYNTLENNWSKLEIKGPLGRGTDGSLEYIEQGILLFGGFTDKGENETWIFSLPEAVTTSSTSSSSSLVTSSTLTTSEQSTSAPDIQGSTVSKTLFAFPFISLILLRRKNEKW